MTAPAKAAPVKAVAAKSSAVARSTTPKIFRRCACGGTCDSCSDKTEDRVFRRALAGELTAANDPSETEADRMADAALRATAEPGGDPLAPAIGGSGGAPLSSGLRAYFEPRFGHDLGGVRIHTDRGAQRSARAINAEAYTIGGNIHFGEGYFQPASDRGRRLIAHELAHVVQQSVTPALQRKVHRQSCPHDAPKGSGCGELTWNGPGGELSEQVSIGKDRIIAAKLGSFFGGTWVAQLQSPPNAEKGGSNLGYVDASKVSTGGALAVEVLEIKSRNTTMGNGGCHVATSETRGYVNALKPLEPYIVKLSAGLAKQGGLRTDACRKMRAEDKKKLVDAGLDLSDETAIDAWCTYNSLQNRLNTTFKTAFSSASFTVNTDGVPGKDYLIGVIPVTCKRSGKNVPGVKRFIFEVNGKGGLSYRCDKKCGKQDDDEERKDKPIEAPAEKDAHRTLEEHGDEDYDPDEHDIHPPAEGYDPADVAIVTATGVATIYAIHKALENKARTEAEKAVLRAAGKQVIDKMEREGAYEAARVLNGKNAVKWGTKEAEALMVKAEQITAQRLARTTEEQVAKRLSARLGVQAAKQGAKGLFKAAGKILPVVGILLTAKDVLGATIQLSRGAEIKIGFSASESHLGSGTKVKVKGDKSKGDGITSDVDLDHTSVDIEVTKAPDVKGVMDLETKSVTFNGKVDAKDGAPVTVNLKMKIENTTITFTSTGRFKGRDIVVDGGLDITDSTIEIDLPPDAVLDPPEPGKTKTIKGAKVKVTKVGSGGGTGDPSKDQAQAGGAGKADKDKPPAKDKAPLSEQQKKLIGDIQAEPNVKKIYDKIVAAKGVRMSEEALRRLLAIKDVLKQKPQLADRLIALLEKAEINDPIKDLIEPLEAELKKAAEEDAKKAKQAPPPPPPTTTTTTKQQQPPPPTTPTTPPPTVDPCANADKLVLWDLIFNPPKDVKVDREGRNKVDRADDKPTEKVTAPLIFIRSTPRGPRRYNVPIPGDNPQTPDASDGDLSKFTWSARYDFHAPRGPFKSENGDQPICFTDADVVHPMLWGKYKKRK